MSEKPTYEDLEQENQALKKIVSENDFMERIFQAVDNSIMILDRDHNILSANLATEKITGLPSKKIIGKKCYEIFHYPNKIPDLCPMQKMMNSEKPEVQEMIVEVLDKTYLISCSPVFDENSKLIRVMHIGTDITDQKKTEKALKKSENKFKSYMKYLPGVAYIKDHLGRYVYLNKTFEKIFNTKLELWEGKTDGELNYFPPEVVDQLVENDKYVLKSRKSLETIEDIPFDDQMHYWLTIKFPLIGKTEKETFLAGVAIDITDQKLAEQKLSDSQERFDIAMNATKDGLYDWNLETNEIYYSPGWKRMLGYNYDELPNDFSIWENLTEPEDVESSWTMLNELITKKRDRFEMEFKMKHKDGHWVDILSRATAIFDDTGKAIRVVGTHVDITERKKDEELLKKQNYYLEKSQALGQIGTWELDLINNILTWTDENCRIFGVPADSVVDYETFLSKVHPDDREYVDREWKKGIEGKPYDIEHRLLIDGEVKWVREKADISFDENGKAVYAIGFTQDISERKMLERQLFHSHKMESIGTLAGGIAHEFNNILSIIIGNNELIMQDLPEWSLSKENCEEIRLAGIRARDVVKHLLTFSRHDASTKKPIDMASVIKDALNLVRSSTPSNIEIKDRISSDCLPIFGDTTQIHQIIINLCNNAVDALPISGGQIDIELCNIEIKKAKISSTEPKQPGKYVRLLVCDNGSGIDTEIIERIFEPYFTTKDVGKGSGIGLSVVHGIVKNHSGSIICESSKGEGTTFTIHIPAYEGRVEEKSEKENILPGNGERILYVDDEPSIAKLGRRHLESLGYDAYSTTDPKEALEMVKAEANRFDLVISDMAMPNMPGDQLIAKILSINPEMPTMICSGYSSRMSETKASEMGIKAFVMKPLNKNELAKKVREVLDSSKQS